MLGKGREDADCLGVRSERGIGRRGGSLMGIVRISRGGEEEEGGEEKEEEVVF
jgi:hypothetical protein